MMAYYGMTNATLYDDVKNELLNIVHNLVKEWSSFSRISNPAQKL